MASKTPRNDDFDVNAVAVTADQHDKDISLLADRIKKLEENFGNHESIAATLKTTCSKAVDMQDIFAAEFKRLLEHDHHTRAALVQFIIHSDRNWFIAKLRQTGLLVWSLIMIGIGAVITGLAGHFFVPK